MDYVSCSPIRVLTARLAAAQVVASEKLSAEGARKLAVVNERNCLCLLKNSFQGISPAKFVCKLLNVRSP